MKKTNLTAMQEKMAAITGPAIREKMGAEYADLCGRYAEKPESLLRHCRNNIFPVVTAFHGLIGAGYSRPQAAKLADKAFLELMERPAGAIRRAMKVPGLYHIMPWLWKTLLPRLFSPEAGFCFRFYPEKKGEIKFDITACPYRDICMELDCGELAPTFCATDDLCYGHMHPRLIWNRTKTMARGGDVCDFDLYIDRDKSR